MTGWPKLGASARRMLRGTWVVEHLVLEVGAHLGDHLLGEVRALVDHREQHALDLELRVERALDALQRRRELGDALEGEVLALERDQHGLRGGQGVEREQPEARRAVDDHVVVAAGDRRERLLQAVLAGDHAHELHLGPGQVAVGGHELQVLEVRRDHELLDRTLLDQRLVQARPALAGLAPEARGEVALGIGVDREHSPLGRGEARGEVDGGRGLADAALLVGDRDDASHGPSWFGPARPFRVWRRPRLWSDDRSPPCAAPGIRRSPPANRSVGGAGG